MLTLLPSGTNNYQENLTPIPVFFLHRVLDVHGRLDDNTGISTVKTLANYPPQLTGMEVTSGTLRFGTAQNEIQISLTFDENVTVNGDVSIPITIGGNLKSAAYLEGNGSKTVVFSYPLTSSDFDLDGILIASIDLGSGSVQGPTGDLEDTALN